MKIAIVDADLLDGGTRHPNLALLKIAGILHDNSIPFELIDDTNADVSSYDHVFMSKVFTFTRDPAFYTKAIGTRDEKKFHVGGTGYYATEANVVKFKDKREKDMTRLENDEFISKLKNKYGLVEKPCGIDMARQMPYYHLYDGYVQKKMDEGVKETRYKDYLYYSIGFLTRGCYRHCPFCVNKNECGVKKYSELEWFHDKSRPYVYFWDDNFLAAPKDIWKPILQDLIDRKIKFQFRQGLDERQFAENKDGEEMAMMLSKARYHGDFIFAFDNWKDRDIIRKALKVWKKYNPKHSTKFYLFCGFLQQATKKDRFFKDIYELFERIKILMQFGCVGYVMRHEDYHKSPLPNFYVQVARWCNQQQFYKKMSFWQYCFRNQSFWEQGTLGRKDRPDLISYEEFQEELKSGYYRTTKMCLPLKTLIEVLNMFPEKKDELLKMFNYSYASLKDAYLKMKN